MTIFTEIAVLLALAAALSIIAYRLKQPPIIGYIVAGLIVGPLGYIQFRSIELVDSLATIGIALLLFLVGLEMDMREIKHVGKAVLYTGLGQIIFTFVFGMLISLGLGFSPIVSAYIAIALTFSSTVIVVKLLSDKGDLDSLYGRIVVGFLVVQDFVAIVALIVLPGLVGEGGGGFDWGTLGLTVLKGVILFSVIIFVARKLFPLFLNFIGRSQEVLFISSLAWGLGVAAFVSSPVIGFSPEIGGFIAGLALANSSVHFQIASRIRPIRDFFVVLFFVVLGAKMLIGGTLALLFPSLILSLFVLIGNPIIVLILMGFLGYRARTSFKASLTVAQISEFSLIIAALGLRLGHLEASHVALVTIVGIVTILISSYLIIYSNQLYHFFRRPLRFFEFRKKTNEDRAGSDLKNHIVVVGANRMGSSVVQALAEKDKRFAVVDLNPQVVARLAARNITVFYGDISDEEIQEKVHLRNARVIVSTVPDLQDNLIVSDYRKKNNPRAKLVLTAEDAPQAQALYKAGADYVFVPHLIGGKQLAHLISDDQNLVQLGRFRSHDLALLKEQ